MVNTFKLFGREYSYSILRSSYISKNKYLTEVKEKVCKRGKTEKNSFKTLFTLIT